VLSIGGGLLHGGRSRRQLGETERIGSKSLVSETEGKDHIDQCTGVGENVLPFSSGGEKKNGEYLLTEVVRGRKLQSGHPREIHEKSTKRGRANQFLLSIRP